MDIPMSRTKFCYKSGGYENGDGDGSGMDLPQSMLNLRNGVKTCFEVIQLADQMLDMLLANR